MPWLPEPTSAEWNRAERRRALSAHWVAADYEIVDGVVRAVEEPPAGTGEERTYFPMANPSMLGDFARLRVGDSASLLTFTRRWGLLGYDALSRRGTASLALTSEGDPVAWVWAHLSGMQTALRLWKFWREGDAAGAERLLRKREVSQQQWRALARVNTLLKDGKFVEAQALLERHLAKPHDSDESDRAVVVVSADGAKVAHTLYNVSTGEGQPWFGVWNIIRSIINPNLRGVHPEISTFAGRSPDVPVVAQGWDAIMSVIYRHLFEVIASDQERGEVEECRECTTPFIRTDGRQRFCPPPPGSRESLCAMRFHKREQRKRKDGRAR